jgi:polyphosphate kinase
MPPLQPSSDLLTPETYINRELSWLEFNRRVLAQARDESLPLLERLKFLAIFSSNTDEFFMVRVATIHNKLKLSLPTTRPDGVAYPALIARIRDEIMAMMHEQRDLMKLLIGRLAEHGVRVAEVASLGAVQQGVIRRYFQEEVYPILTPLAVDHARPFPFISNLSLNLAILLRREELFNDEIEFVRLKLPDTTPRLISLNDICRRYNGEGMPEDQVFLWQEDVIGSNLDLLFPGMRVVEYVPFRVTRNADIDYENERDDHDDADISDIIEEGLKERRFGSIVRLSVPDTIAEPTLRRLLTYMPVERDRDVYLVNGALGGSALWGLMGVNKPELKHPPYIARVPEGFGENDDIFATIRAGDRLVHHPYDSFAAVERFFQAAARDPQVQAIKATLYRVGRNSPIVNALLDARDHGKQVAVLVELKARFDEENNLTWARQLEEKGVHVTYGVEELPIKTHAKVALVVRHEPDGVARYVHLATGNYNSSTARLYTDLGIFTADRAIADDATRLFNRLTGFAPATTYSRLLVAPEYLLPALTALIDGETTAARDGKPARIILKMNQLEEDTLIARLYEASMAGVQIDLIVRGICCLRPGVPGLSENIRVRSIVGRFLEHSRIFYFQNAPPQARLYLGSADMMRRNLYNRVEVVFPVLDERLQRQVMRVLETELADNMDAWALNPDATYTRLVPGIDETPIRSQDEFMRDSFGLDSAASS